ncbi:hypothetical protein [Butyrivibrio sp. INlla16]|uniref:hypothetical protein n=1 Tax=Butyrivibrio sp. INlla16 TaxID=1520807 RepID=UPI001A9A34C8|nr:hypothetical protein [Butyrivibrio sp. INlla16]
MREDSVWILPFLVFAMLFCDIYWIRNKTDIKTVIKKLAISICPFVGIIVAVTIVTLINGYAIICHA